MEKTNQPHKLIHREAMRKFGKRSKIDKIIERTFREFDRKNKALYKWKTFIINNLHKYQNQINEKMKADGTIIKSLVLIHQNGDYKIYVAVRVKMVIDSRGDIAISLIKEFLDRYKRSIKTDKNTQLIISLLKDVFISRRRELVVTQGLINFIRLDRYKIKDASLREAHKILKEAISAQESGPVVRLYQRINNKWETYRGNAG